jgi:hypothetical protein
MTRTKGALNLEWLDTKDAAIALGIQPRHLRKLRPGMTLGTHYRIISPKKASRPTYQWNPDRCAEYLQMPLEKR